MPKIKAQPFGFHANIDVPEQAVLDAVTRSHARTHTALNSAGLGQKMYDAAAAVIAEEPIIISRISYPDQDWNAGDEKNPDTFVRDLNGYMGGRLYLQYLNEPVVGGSVDQLRTMLARCRQFMSACVKYNCRGSVAAFPDASTINKNWVDAGEFDAFLKDAVDWTRGGHGVVNHHQYTFGSLMHGGGGKNPLDMTNPALMQPGGWPTKQQMIDHAAEDWHILRNLPLLQRAVQLKGQEYLWVIGEATHDDMPDYRQNGISPKIEAARGVGKLRGVLDQKVLFSWWWPQWSDAQGYIEQLRWFAGVLPASCLGVTIYALNGDVAWQTYNMLNWPGFWPVFYSFADQISASSGVTPVTPTPVAKPKEAVVATTKLIKSDYNIRSGPGTNYGKVASATRGATVKLYLDYFYTANGFKWRWIEVGSFSGWIADEGQWIDPSATFGPLAVNLPVPFVSQSGAINDCGPAMDLMLIWYKDQVIGSDKHAKLTHQQIRADMGAAAGTYTSVDQNEDAMADYGLVTYDGSNRVVDVVAELNAGRPVGILYERGDFPGAQAYYDFTGNHFSTVNGFGYMSDGKYFLSVIDPLGKDNGPGDGLFVSEGNFAAGILFTIYIDPKSLEVEDDGFTDAQWSAIDEHIDQRIDEKMGAGQ